MMTIFSVLLDPLIYCQSNQRGFVQVEMPLKLLIWRNLPPSPRFSFSPLWTITLVVVGLFVRNCVNILALHFNIMTIPHPPKNQHQLQNFDV